MNITPRNNMVLLEIIEEESKSEGGIILMHTAGSSTTEMGIVVALGKGKTLPNGNRIAIDSDIKIGSKVAIMSSYGEPVGDTQRIVEDVDILYVVL